MGSPRLLRARRARRIRVRLLVLPPLEGRLRGSAIDVGALDRAALEFAQQFAHPTLDLIGSTIGLLGLAEVTFGIALGLAVARWRRGAPDAIVPLLIFAAVAIEAVLKLTLPHPAPPDESVRSIDLVPAVHVAFPNSFPSGHVLRVTFLAAIVHGVPTWISGMLVLLMVASRVYLGEHWLSDCIGGLALGLIAAGVGYAVFGRRDDGDRAAIARPGAQRRR